MPRKKVLILANEPYHITARCLNKEWFSLPLETVWSIMEDFLFLLVAGFGVRIHSFILMSNHFHLLITAPNGNLSSAMLYFMRETSKEITRLSGRINQTYGSRNHKTRITNYHHFMNTYKYIYQNPIRAKLCTNAEDYPFSTLNGLCRGSKLTIPVDEDLLFNPLFDEGLLTWLNTPIEERDLRDMRLALKHSEIQFLADKNTGVKSRLIKELI